MFIKSWGEIFFDILAGSAIYYVANKNGKNTIQQKWNDSERDKQIQDLQRQIEELKKGIPNEKT
jgi:hypothetical protein